MVCYEWIGIIVMSMMGIVLMNWLFYGDPRWSLFYFSRNYYLQLPSMHWAHSYLYLLSLVNA